MTDGIAGSARFWRRNRHWQVLLEAPDWVIQEMVSEGRDRGLFVLNYGGTINSPTLTMLIGTSAGGYDPSTETGDEPLAAASVPADARGGGESDG